MKLPVDGDPPTDVLLLLLGPAITLSSEELGGGLWFDPWGADGPLPEPGLFPGLLAAPNPGLFGLAPPGLFGGLGLLELGLFGGPPDDTFAPLSDEEEVVNPVDTEAVHPVGPQDVVAIGKAIN